MLSAAEQSALAVFRVFMVSPGEMLCFHGPQLAKHGATLRRLADKNLVVQEQFAGGYSLTRAGFEAMAASRHSEVAPPSVARASVARAPASSPSAASHSSRRR